MNILAIESSCDDTCAAVVRDGREVLSSVVASQVPEHIIYGGVVPEIASRRHCEAVSGAAKKALSDAGLTLDGIDAVAVTYAPGLIGALLVGVGFAKGLAYSCGKPLVPVHHLRGHVASNYISHPDLEPPFLALVVSGGHTHLVHVLSYTEYKVLGRTRDDAAGEAMDKAARAMGLDYPGGLNMDRLCADGDRRAYAFPRPNVSENPLDFSFSGLKTFVVNLIHRQSQKDGEVDVKNVGASFMHAVASILCENTGKALDLTGAEKLVVAGGVSANSVLRAEMAELCAEKGVGLYVPELRYCGDNAAMIGSQAYYEFISGRRAGLDLNAVATLDIEL